MLKVKLIKTSTTIEELPSLVDYALYAGIVDSHIIKPLEACYDNGRRIHSADKVAFVRGYIVAKRTAQIIVSNTFED